MEKFTVHSGKAVPLRRSNVDTDQIIPVRFLTRSSRSGHAAALFADWRDTPGFVLDRPAHRGATVLVAGTEFGTGSSREYAVWALADHGFRAVIAPRFGDIFQENALMNGLLTVVVPVTAVERLWDLVEADPAIQVTVDLERLEVRCTDLVQPFSVDRNARARLLAGMDPISETLQHIEEIDAYEQRRRPTMPTTLV